MTKQQYLAIIGNNIRQLRQSRGLSQFDLSVMAKITRTKVSRIELGNFANIRFVMDIAHTLRVSPDTLFQIPKSAPDTDELQTSDNPEFADQMAAQTEI